MASLQQNVVGHLRLACSTTAGKYILPLLAAHYRQRYPGIRTSILTCTPEHIIPRLLEGEANLGVVSSEGICGNELECQEFFKDSITLIVPADHPWTFRQAIEPAELLEESLIIREPTSGTRRVLLTELAQHDITLDDLNIYLELGNAEAIVRTVIAGFGASFVSTLAADCALEQRQVVEVPVTGHQNIFDRCFSKDPIGPFDQFRRSQMLCRRQSACLNLVHQVFQAGGYLNRSCGRINHDDGQSKLVTAPRAESSNPALKGTSIIGHSPAWDIFKSLAILATGPSQPVPGPWPPIVPVVSNRMPSSLRP